MKTFSTFLICVLCFVANLCDCYKILAVFPYNGRSHHIYYSSLVEELATRKHEVTVINYFPLKKLPNLRQISLLTENISDTVHLEDHINNTPNLFTDLFKAYDSAKAFEFIANSNCERMLSNKDVQDIVNNEAFDVVIAEQFVTDCGLALAHKLNAPTVGTTAHVLMSWTYSRLGATNNPTFVPNHYFNSGSKPGLVKRMKSFVINLFVDTYYKYIIQRNDNEIVRKYLPGTPDLEMLGKNLSLILLNQYFPLTGSRLYGANVVEVGGMHIKDVELKDKELLNFLNEAKHGVIYISFGTVASDFPQKTLNEIIKVMQKSKMKFVWKIDGVNNMNIPSNALVRKWWTQPAILCHPKVLAFISHSGMLSSSEAMHCGVPIISVPLFGDQFANAASAVENGLGVTVYLLTMNEIVLDEAIKTVLQGRYQKRAKHLSQLWRDRPLSPMDTAVYWIEYVAKYKGVINMKPPTVDLPLYQYLMLDLVAISAIISILASYVFVRLVKLVSKANKNEREIKGKTKKKN